MPELPEVETVRRGLAPRLTGRRIGRVEVRRVGLRRPFPADLATLLAGQRIGEIGRRAKYLLFAFDSGMRLLLHLGMSGRLTLSEPRADGEAPPELPGPELAGPELAGPELAGPELAGPELAGPEGALYFVRPPDPVHDHLRFHFAPEVNEPALVLTFNDPRRFGDLALAAPEEGEFPALAGLGPEPSGDEFTGNLLHSRLRGRKGPVKTTLLDQKVVAGLGNIYVCEALYRAGIHPAIAAGAVPEASCETLANAIRDVLAEALEAGGSSLRDYAGSDGAPGYFQHRFDVYDREAGPCPRPGCEGMIARLKQAGRSTFFCPACQGMAQVPPV